MKDDEKRGESPRFLFAFLHASRSILRGFYNAVSLPGDCHVAILLAMTECFARNEKVLLLAMT